jgi:predicted signal transduction protein with EAL and GGDEF domain
VSTPAADLGHTMLFGALWSGWTLRLPGDALTGDPEALAAYFRQHPIDVLKIDRSFVGRMSEGDQPLQIVRTIIELARVLNIDVVAEGIETSEQYLLLRELGCLCGQGFLFAKPMPAEQVSTLLRLPGRMLPCPSIQKTTPDMCFA